PSRSEPDGSPLDSSNAVFFIAVPGCRAFHSSRYLWPLSHLRVVRGRNAAAPHVGCELTDLNWIRARRMSHGGLVRNPISALCGTLEPLAPRCARPALRRDFELVLPPAPVSGNAGAGVLRTCPDLAYELECPGG